MWLDQIYEHFATVSVVKKGVRLWGMFSLVCLVGGSEVFPNQQHCEYWLFKSGRVWRNFTSWHGVQNGWTVCQSQVQILSALLAAHISIIVQKVATWSCLWLVCCRPRTSWRRGCRSTWDSKGCRLERWSAAPPAVSYSWCTQNTPYATAPPDRSRRL